MASGESFYVTTPIFYVNDVPHIGHAYTEVAADALARWHRQRGDDTWLLTGTDEHGQKILRSAVANGVTPREWADRLVETAWKPLLETIEISNDDFIRTTDERHETAVARFFQKLYDDGHIYTGEYEGYYCVGCEEYKQPDDLIRAESGEFAGELVCRIHSRPVELLQERNYFFRMSAFQDKLLALYRDRPDFVQPESLRNELIRFVEQGLQDLSISRSTFDWGITVPWDPSHVIYVWVDALLNYITAVGWGDDDQDFARRWPAVHIVGKDIARFHAVIWPAMLMAAGLEVPRRVFGHGWLLVGGEKMSKSKLTGIAPHQITEVFGSDAFRYYFLRAIAFGQDGSFSWEDIAARYHAELANGLGNLASRTLAMVERYRGGVIPAAPSTPLPEPRTPLPEPRTPLPEPRTPLPEPVDGSDAEARIREIEERATRASGDAIDRLAIHEAIAAVWELVDALNLYITEQQPWVLAKDESQAERLDVVLRTAVRGLGTLAVLLAPIMPQTMARLWSAVGGEGAVDDVDIRTAPAWTGGDRIAPLTDPLFPRIESEADAKEAGAA